MDWSDPESRLALLEAVGPEEYNRRHKAYQDSMVVSTVNGYRIRKVQASAMGPLIYLVEGTNHGFSTQGRAETFAREQPAKEAA